MRASNCWLTPIFLHTAFFLHHPPITLLAVSSHVPQRVNPKSGIMHLSHISSSVSVIWLHFISSADPKVKIALKCISFDLEPLLSFIYQSLEGEHAGVIYIWGSRRVSEFPNPLVPPVERGRAAFPPRDALIWTLPAPLFVRDPLPVSFLAKLSGQNLEQRYSSGDK